MRLIPYGTFCIKSDHTDWYSFIHDSQNGLGLTLKCGKDGLHDSGIHVWVNDEGSICYRSVFDGVVQNKVHTIKMSAPKKKTKKKAKKKKIVDYLGYISV